MASHHLLSILGMNVLCFQRAPCSALKKMAGFPGLFPAGVLPALLLWVSMWGSPASGFSVMGPAQPIKVSLGADATLPCQLSSEQSAAHMQIRWYRTQLSPAVLVYQDGQEQDGEQMLEYRGRTELVEDSIGRGAVALLIQHVRASDDGQYWCHFNDGHISREAVVELHVIGLGSAPHVRMMGPEDHGIQVLCSSGGWFPKPRVQWSDTAGEKLLSLSEYQTQDGDGLFHVEASLVVTDSSLGNVTCSIQNPVSGQEKASAIFLPEPFFPRTSPWKIALAGTLPVLVLLLIGISYIGWKEHKAKNGEVEKKKKASHERDKVAREKEEAQSLKSKSGSKSNQRFLEKLQMLCVQGRWGNKKLLKNPEENTGCQEFHRTGSSMQRRKPHGKLGDLWAVVISLQSTPCPFKPLYPNLFLFAEMSSFIVSSFLSFKNKLQKHLRNRTPGKHGLAFLCDPSILPT
uniref:Ig-like domain-containing protein n=1 Tax=Bos indicus x Bos taurus TaxID=30522 RepID=A0A4W2GKS7_BOBOX